MTLDPGPLVTFGRIADVGGALLFLGLGLFVATVKPRRRVNVAFAVFGIGFGVAWTLGNIEAVPVEWANVATLALSPLATAGLVMVALEFPTQLKGQHRRWAAWVLAAGVAAAIVAMTFAPNEVYLGANSAQSVALRLVTAALFNVGFGSLLMLLALRYAGAGVADERSRALTLLATWAFVPYFAVATGIYGVMRITRVSGAHSAYGYAAAPGLFIVLIVVIALWLRNTGRLTGPPARSARNVALGAAALGAAGAAWAIAFGVQNMPNNLGVMGLARGVGVALLAYAILKHQLFDIDVRLRFAVKGSTLAAIFVGVFFVVSEGAQQFFGDQYQNEYLGIAAAGGLVFAMAPLQRLADRVATKAVPSADTQAGLGPADFYRRQVETAWMDGAMTRREGIILGELRERLNLTEEQARRIEAEAMAKVKARRLR